MRAIILLAAASVCIAADPQSERFLFRPKEPKWLTANLDIRDASDRLWPNFVGGRNAEGEVSLTRAGLSGMFVTRFDQHSQFEAGQERRVLGDAVLAKPAFELRITEVRGAFVAKDAESALEAELAGDEKRPEPPKQATLIGTLSMLGKTIPIEQPADIKRLGERLIISGSIEVEGSRLGLRPERISLAFAVTGYRSQADLKAGPAGPSLEPDLDR